jgi:type I restriction enzyme M protein
MPRTLLRLPAGLFYAQGVKSNVLFFDRPHIARQKSASDVIWAYDLRSDKRFSVKTKPLQREDLEEFVTLSTANVRRAGERFRSFEAAQILATTECRLDIRAAPDHPLAHPTSSRTKGRSVAPTG